MQKTEIPRRSFLAATAGTLAYLPAHRAPDGSTKAATIVSRRNESAAGMGHAVASDASDAAERDTAPVTGTDTSSTDQPAQDQPPQGQRAQRTAIARAKGDANKRFPVKAIASHNGLEATRRAFQMMQQGHDTLDAVVASVSLVEADANDLTVGYGGLPNENGVVELDAAVMHGPSHRAGAVASLQNIRHPSQVAQWVMKQTDHVLLVGDGALQFARAVGFQEENLLTEKARKIWLYWKQSLSERDDWLTPPVDELDPDVIKFFKLKRDGHAPGGAGGGDAATGERSGSARSIDDWTKFDRPTGTVHCAGMNASGEVSCTTTTSGLAFKIPGRVGDSPIIGAGLYVDADVGSCGSTGRGEANLQNLCCSTAVESMRSGMTPEEAGLEMLRRVAAKTTEKRLLDKRGRPNFGLKFYLLAQDGSHAGVSMWGPAQFAVTDEQGTRLEECATLYRKGT